MDKLNDSSSRRPPSATAAATGGGVYGGERLRRDEWSEGAVSSLLEAYEAKWILRNRAKLKGHDWEDVAKCVSSRAISSKSSKTQTQCKNKIESMKKRYRLESAKADVQSTWPLFQRLDLLLRGSGGPPVVTSASGQLPSSSIKVVNSLIPFMAFDHALASQPPHPPPPVIHSSSIAVVVSEPALVSTPVQQVIGQNSIDSNGVDRENKEQVVVTKEPSNLPSEKMETETNCSTPTLYSNDKENIHLKNHKTRITESRKRRRRGENRDVSESIRWLAKVMVRSEQDKFETMLEFEKTRLDAEVKRGEIDLKRLEIVAHTQLEIARLFVTSLGNDIAPCLKMGRS